MDNILDRIFNRRGTTRRVRIRPDIPDVPPICPNCNSRPVAPKATAGQFFDYCGKACAGQARKSGATRRAAQAQIDLCEQCHLRPKFKDGTKVHSYCGRTCAKLAANPLPNPQGLPVFPPPNPPLNPPTTPPTTPPSRSDSIILPQFTPGPVCQTPGCTLPAFVHQDGTPSNYCQMTHKKWGEQGCISCRAAPRNGPSVLCQPCHTDALSSAPAIIEVPKDHKNYKSVESQFKQTWRHTTACPEVRAVYKIIVTETSLRQYQQYLDSVEAKGNFVAMGKSRGNENRRWHGTKRKCLLGNPGYTSFCAESGCSLCCIIKSSFDVRFFKQATGWGRFGQGIYTSSTSSKSNDYSKNIGVSSELKALLLNKVVVGNGKKMINDDTSLTTAPSGFDSVLAEVASGGSLNYDELIVYHNDAVRPSYLVMYKSP